jgi:hypothetical protein
MPHLPYALDDDDEFFHPKEGWLLLDRTIAFDSWIHWRQALPKSRLGRSRLCERTAALIEALAERLHALHQHLPGYADLDDTPFRFSRWWEPSSEGQWSQGSSCVFRIDGCAGRDVVEAYSATPGLEHMAITVMPDDQVRAELCGIEVEDFISGQPGLRLSLPPVARPQKKSRPRRTPNPPR